MRNAAVIQHGGSIKWPKGQHYAKSTSPPPTQIFLIESHRVVDSKGGGPTLLAPKTDSQTGGKPRGRRTVKEWQHMTSRGHTDALIDLFKYINLFKFLKKRDSRLHPSLNPSSPFYQKISDGRHWSVTGSHCTKGLKHWILSGRLCILHSL